VTPADRRWSRASVPTTIAAHEIHVWRALLDAGARALATLENTLSPDERHRADRMHFQRDRRRFVVARGVLRRLLGAYLGVAASRVRFAYGGHGKPFLVSPPSAPSVSFNLSHSDDVALYAIALDRALGVDVERVGSDSRDDVIARVFSASERQTLDALAPDARRTAAVVWWTAKEAYMKARGLGLSLDPAGLEVVRAGAALVGVRRITGDETPHEPWTVRVLDPWPGYVAALVAEGRGLSFFFREWPGEEFRL
jgi:4'-phosphopantetheinyl transferase